MKLSDDLVQMLSWEPRLWSLANAVTAFALAQSLFSAYQFGQTAFRDNFTKPRVAYLALFLLSFITCFESLAVVLCAWKAKLILAKIPYSTIDIQRSLWTWATVGRVAAILLFAIAPLLGILGTFGQHRVSG